MIDAMILHSPSETLTDLRRSDERSQTPSLPQVAVLLLEPVSNTAQERAKAFVNAMPPTPQIPLVTASTRVLPDLLDFHAEKNPELPWAVYPTSDTTTSSISFTELSKATHRIAYSIRPQGPDAGRDAVIMLLHCDTIMYATMVMSICRAGLVVRVLMFSHLLEFIAS